MDVLILVSGVSTFRALSPAMAYSVCLYAMVNTVTYFAVRYNLIPFFKKDDSFENLVYVIMLIMLLSNFVCVPVFSWFDARKAVEYLEKWKMFQVCVDAAKYLGASLSLQMQTWLVSR
jgi:hypothetical protein